MKIIISFFVLFLILVSGCGNTGSTTETVSTATPSTSSTAPTTTSVPSSITSTSTPAPSSTTSLSETMTSSTSKPGETSAIPSIKPKFSKGDIITDGAHDYTVLDILNNHYRLILYKNFGSNEEGMEPISKVDITFTLVNVTHVHNPGDKVNDGKQEWTVVGLDSKLYYLVNAYRDYATVAISEADAWK